MTPRVLIGADAVVAGMATLDERSAHYLVSVLRLGAGDDVQAFDGVGSRYAARIVAADRRQVRLAIGERLAGIPAQPFELTLLQGIAQADRMDLVVEKATELGAARIVPLLTERSGVRLDGERAARRVAHWRRVSVAACMQCGRDILPEISPPTSIADWLRTGGGSKPGTQRLLLAPSGGERLSAIPLDRARPVAVAVGPESGLSEPEAEALAGAGFAPVPTGPRVLRTETAGLAAIAAIAVRIGDF